MMEQTLGNINALAFDLPILYKKSLFLYPVVVKDYFVFQDVKECLFVDRSYEKDIEMLTFPDMEYLYKKAMVDETGKENWIKFLFLLKLVFNIPEKDISFGYMGQEFMCVIQQGKETEPVAISCQDFEELRPLILEMNGIAYESFDAAWETQLKKAQEAMFGINQKEGIEFQDAISAIAHDLGRLPNEIQTMPIRRYQIYLEEMLEREEFNRCRAAELQGTKFKTKLTPWLKHFSPKGRYSNVLSKNVDNITKQIK